VNGGFPFLKDFRLIAGNSFGDLAGLITNEKIPGIFRVLYLARSYLGQLESLGRSRIWLNDSGTYFRRTLVQRHSPSFSDA